MNGSSEIARIAQDRSCRVLLPSLARIFELNACCGLVLTSAVLPTSLAAKWKFLACTRKGVGHHKAVARPLHRQVRTSYTTKLQRGTASCICLECILCANDFIF